MSGESAESEHEAALGSPEVGRVLHTVHTDLVRLEQLGPDIGDEGWATIRRERLLATPCPRRLYDGNLLELGLDVSDLRAQ